MYRRTRRQDAVENLKKGSYQLYDWYGVTGEVIMRTHGSKIRKLYCRMTNQKRNLLVHSKRMSNYHKQLKRNGDIGFILKISMLNHRTKS